MDASLRLVFLLLLAAAASAQLSADFYKASCPDAEKIIFGVVEKRFKADPGTAAGLLRLVFHDCFANNSTGSTSVIRTSSVNADQMAGLSQPGSSPRKVGPPDEVETPAIVANEAAAKVPGGVVVSVGGDQQQSPNTVVPPNVQQPPNTVVPPNLPQPGAEPLGQEKVADRPGLKLRGSGEPVNQVPVVPGGEDAARQQALAALEEKKKRNMAKLRGAAKAHQ
ncbi:unnamed protein product [Miscanthus lutarioriparius]|uniref:Plant heme peroxidase family profile domain-containing protein n=1 Tax=Miscanthus lutarioriparius TaxID=422564 RepID=A0A811MMA9_9POAL|nr:unnamed protein product [Miscanthus lutarioriparius]